MLRNLFIISILIVCFGSASAQDQAEYIRKYQDLAVAEMIRTGIPASIKLSQALLESNCGRSDLACKANNHFGIKCGSNWDGKSYHKEDDDYADGKLVKSCFREFNCVRDSYIAHSDFLADPAKAARYGFLFQLDPTDYKGWAKGLSKAGYATDPQYATRLIDLIEKYELYRFDNEYNNPVASNAPPASSAIQLIKYNNKVKYTLAQKGDNATLLAKRNDMSVSKIMHYNEDITSKDQALVSGSKVYLEPKKSAYHGKEKYHMLKEGEDLYLVSNKYGVKLDALAKRNGLEKNEVPLPRQKIMLKGKPKTELKTADPYQVPGTKKTGGSKPVVPSGEVKSLPVAPSDRITASTSNQPVGANKPSTTKGEPLVAHTVMKGDTLYGIARTYGITVDDLRKKNNLAADTIYVGQKLVWK